MEVCKVTSHEKNKNKNKKSYYKATRKLEKNREKKMAIPLEYVISRP